MISGLLSQLQNQYSLANAPNPAPAVSDPNGLSGLLQTTGIPMTENPMGMRTPNYMGLLGMMGQQPFTPGYTGIGGAVGPEQSDYLDRVLGGINPSAASQGMMRYSNPDMFTAARIPSPAELSRFMVQNGLTPFTLRSALPPRVAGLMDADQAMQGGE